MEREAFRREKEIPVKKFVQCVRKHRCLYDNSDENYNNRREVDNAWNAIAAEMNDTERYCRERWKNIRTVFVRQLKYRPGKRRSYYLDKELKFLIPHLKKRDQYQAEYNRLLDEAGNEDTRMEDEEEERQNESDLNFKNEIHINDNFEADDSLMGGEDNYNEFLCDPIADTPAQTSKNNTSNNPSNVNNCKLQNDLSSDEYFLLGLLPEFTSLTSKRKRQFKLKVLTLLNDLHDEQENETTTVQ